MEQIRIERIPYVLQTYVQHQVHHCSILYRKRESNSQNSDSKSDASTSFAIPAICGSSRIRTYSVIRQRCYRPLQLSYSDVLPNLSGKQDSNLQPPASKAGKQPIVIFPEITNHKISLLRLIRDYSVYYLA